MTAWTFFDGNWHEGNPQLMGPLSHAPWLGSVVFDGARAFEGVTPDLDRHCERLIRSATSFGLRIPKSAGAIEEIAREGVAKFPRGAELYIRPMAWAEEGFIDVDPESTRYCVSVYDEPMPAPNGFSITCSPFRRPSYEYAPTDAKAACHYPNSARVLREARSRGFHNGLMLDPLGNVSELSNANIFYARDGEVHTPVPNGTFLLGITRRRVIGLLRGAGMQVHERTLGLRDFLEADEIFATSNFAKVMPVTRIEARDLRPGPVYARARELYWAFAHGAA
jgi:branched-chain amino acid aminotransferase